ncbi:glycosyltransferase family 39 protein, partial [Candidatus Micrarchaeota archaeon]|nr:glycosyltransferase family 39 protein [Candidatus Micrarchaeota archaeon]
LYPTLMKTILIAIILLIVYNLNDITKPFKKINRRTWVILFLVFLCGLTIRLFSIPHIHQLYFDEFSHLNVAENILYSNKSCWCFAGSNQVCEGCQLMPQPPGYPTILALTMGLFGDSEAVAFNTTAVIGSVSIILVFLLLFLTFQDSALALMGAFVFTFIPAHLKYSGTTVLEVFSLFSVVLAMISIEIYLRTKKPSTFSLFLATLLYALNSRVENFLLLIPLSLYILLEEGKEVKRFLKKEYLAPIFIFLVLLIPLAQLISYDLAIGPPTYTETLQTRLSYLQIQFIPNILFIFFDIGYTSIVLSLLCVLGAIELYFENTKSFIYYSLFFLLFISFYSTLSVGGSASTNSDFTRFAFILYVPLTILSVAGINFIFKKMQFDRTILIMLLGSAYLISLFPTQNFIFSKDELNGEHEFILSMQHKLPADVYIISYETTIIISTTHKNSIMPTNFIENWNSVEPKNNVILFEDYWWYENSNESSRIEAELRKHYNFELMAQSPEGYAFYNLTSK